MSGDRGSLRQSAPSQSGVFVDWKVRLPSAKCFQFVTCVRFRFRPLIKRLPGYYRTLLALDGGGVRGIFTAPILEELEMAIKRFLLSHPDSLLPHKDIKTVDDFDINLVDYFDCMTAFSAGSWSALYLASRGGKGAALSFLEKPDFVAKYGRIPAGGAAALRAFFREYSNKIYPMHTINITNGIPFDLTNPAAPGVSSPLFTLDTVEKSLEVLLGNTTLADIDTSVLFPAVDLITGLGIFFVNNKFKTPSVTSSAKLTVRSGPRPAPVDSTGFKSDFIFDEGKNYYLKDIGTAGSTLPGFFPAKNVSAVGNDTVEYAMIDGFFPIEAVELPGSVFVVNENGFKNLRRVATLSIGTGRPVYDFSRLTKAGMYGWMADQSLLNLYVRTSFDSLATLTDYMFYGNPEVKPYQYLRIQASASVTTEEGLALTTATDATFSPLIEAIGEKTAKEHRDSLDAFVRDYVFR